ncbi:MAG TPA: hypothetical protein VKG05_15490 [Steroidobacteraceae bacterium]|nr:hypothetical protein [Steroidobacteraceae bacterium]
MEILGLAAIGEARFHPNGRGSLGNPHTQARDNALRTFDADSSGTNIRSGDRPRANMLASKVGDEVIHRLLERREFRFKLFGNITQWGRCTGNPQTQTGEAHCGPCLARVDTRKGFLGGAKTYERRSRKMSEQVSIHCGGPEFAGNDEVEFRPRQSWTGPTRGARLYRLENHSRFRMMSLPSRGRLAQSLRPR